MLKRLLGGLLIGLALAAPAVAGQATYSMPLTGPQTFGDFLNLEMNPALAAILQNNSGSSAPSVTGQPAAYQWWMDTGSTLKLLKLYDGASWAPIGSLDTTAHTWTVLGSGLTISGTAAISPTANTTTQGINVSQSGPTSGSAGTGVAFNLIHVAGDQSSASGTNQALDVIYGFGGSNMQGQRSAITGFSILNTASSASNANKVYVGISGEGTMNSADGGTNTSTSAAGNMLGLYGSSIAGAGATNLFEIVGQEINTSIRSTASARYAIGQRIAQWADNAVSGAELDGAQQFINQSGAIGWANYGIVFDTASAGAGTLFQSGATMIGSKGSMSLTNGVDLSSATFSGSAFKSPSFAVDGSGNVSGAGVKVSGLTASSAVATDSSKNLVSVTNTGTGNNVLATSPTIASPTVTGAFTATGLVTNTDLANSSVTIAGHAVSLGGTQTIACADLSNGATGCSTATGTSGATIPLLNGANTWSGVQSVNSGDLALKGSSSGSTTLNASAVASGTLTLPAATDTLVAKATTDTFTNKTFDTAGTGNSFSINSVAVTANTGTGAVARAAGPTFTTPTLGVAAATTVNKVTITAPATGSTLTIADGKTLTVNNSLTLAGTDSTTETFPSVSNTLLGAKGQTLLTLLPAGDEPPATSYATWGLRNQHPFIDYTSGGSLVANWTQVLSRNYSGNGLSIVVNYVTASATSGTAQFKMAVERDNAGASIATDNFATAQTATAATVPGTSGLVGQFTIPISAGANMSSAVAGDQVRFQLTRGTDTATGDMEVLSVEVREAP